MIPSYFKIEILAIQDEFVLLGHKGLTVYVRWHALVRLYIYMEFPLTADKNFPQKLFEGNVPKKMKYSILILSYITVLEIMLERELIYEGYSKSSKTNSK